MERSVDYYKDMLKAIKFPKVNLPKINIRDIEKPPRWVVIAIAVLIEIVLLFFILWLFDERTVFDNDYYDTRYSGKYLKWGWVHMGIAITSILIAVGWAITILTELAAWEKNGRAFYNLYRK